jgi:2-methylaconitate cis-trans-isomerase PrpF
MYNSVADVHHTFAQVAVEGPSVDKVRNGALEPLAAHADKSAAIIHPLINDHGRFLANKQFVKIACYTHP